MSFLNSKIWREFQRSVGRDIFELNDDIYLVKMDLPFGKNYLYSPSPRAIEHLDEIKEIGRAQGMVFFKYEPMVTDYGLSRLDKRGWGKRTKDYGFVEAVKTLQPQRTVILDLNLDYDELLKQMHQKTRYNIRLSEKKFLELEKSEDLDVFWNLLQKTSKRTEFNTHTKEYYKKLLELKNVDLYFVKRYDDFVAGAIVISYNNTMTYLHGVSNYNLRKYMGPYFLHWELIKLAKRENMEKYDFWGIDEKKWPGVTRFKKGFGGEEVEYIGSYDYILKRMWYKVYELKNKFVS